jgi:hypothetical protein
MPPSLSALVLGLALAPASSFECAFGGAFRLAVDESAPFAYAVTGAGGAPWLENGTIRCH